MSHLPNGKIERSFRTVKDNFLNCTDWNTFISLDDLNDKYYNYVNFEYNNTVHSSLNDTPRNRFMKDYNRLKFVPSEEALNECFLHSIERKVATDSCIQINGKAYEVPSQYMKQRLLIKYDPYDLDKAYIYKGGKNIHTIYPVKKVDNGKMKRKNIEYSKMEGVTND